MDFADAELEALREAARAASERAYCPYSRHPVGAAVLTASGRVFAAGNVENASFGLTVCAERGAVLQAVANGERKVAALAVYTPGPVPSPPCGACRQVLHEFGPGALVDCSCDGAATIRAPLAELFAAPFEAAHLTPKSDP